MKVIWKDILKYDGQYQISSNGQVRSFKQNKDVPHLIKPFEDRDGYLCVRLTKDGTKRQYRIHRLVAETFLFNRDNKPTVNHKDGNKHNNCIDNLEWATYCEQIRHVVDNNLRSSQSVQVMCIETGQKFPSKRNAETSLGIMKNGVSRSIRSGKPVNGYTFKEIRRITKRTPKKLFSI